MEIVGLDGADDMPIQILDAHIDAVVAEAKLVRLLARSERSLRKPRLDLALPVADVATKKVPPRF
jgi:hypothetical protein